MKSRHIVLLFAILWAPFVTPGCVALAEALAHAGAAGSAIASALDVAEGASGFYFRRHPNYEREEAVAKQLHRVRLALAFYDKTVAAAGVANDAGVLAAREQLLDAYAGLRSLLDEFGVLTARPPEGGLESDDPPPDPVDIPTREEVAAWF